MPETPSTLTRTEIRERRLGTIQQAAEQYHCSARTIRRMIAGGEITGYRVGKRLVRIDLDEVAAVPRVIPAVGGGA